MQMLFTMTR